MNEWLPRIDVTTTLPEVARNASVFNPYPEHATGGIEVWYGENMNFQQQAYHIRYPKINAGCQVSLPISYNEPPSEQLRPSLVEGYEVDADSLGRTGSTTKWTPLPKFWDALGSHLASEYLLDQGRRNGADKLFADLAYANAHTRTTPITEPVPRLFVQQTIGAVQNAIRDGRPEVGYAVAHDLFTPFVGKKADRTVGNAVTADWAVEAMPKILFPGFIDSWQRSVGHDSGDTEALPSETGRLAARIVSGKLSAAAIHGWLTAEAGDTPVPVIEKVELLGQRNAEELMVAVAGLHARLELAKDVFRAATFGRTDDSKWDIPEPLGQYILDKLS